MLGGVCSHSPEHLLLETQYGCRVIDLKQKKLFIIKFTKKLKNIIITNTYRTLAALPGLSMAENDRTIRYSAV